MWLIIVDKCQIIDSPVPFLVCTQLLFVGGEEFQGGRSGLEFWQAYGEHYRRLL